MDELMRMTMSLCSNINVPTHLTCSKEPIPVSFIHQEAKKAEVISKLNIARTFE
jgi:hypothetical protein